MPPKGYQPEPMEKIDDGRYRDTDGQHLPRLRHHARPDALPRRNPTAYVPPTVESLQAEIDALDERAAGRPQRLALGAGAPRREGDEEARTSSCCSAATSAWPALRRDRGGGLDEPGAAARDLPQDRRVAAASACCARSQLYAQLGVDGIMPCGDLGSSTGLHGQPARSTARWSTPGTRRSATRRTGRA